MSTDKKASLKFQPKGMVRKSTMFIAVIFALAVGLYAGQFISAQRMRTPDEKITREALSQRDAGNVPQSGNAPIPQSSPELEKLLKATRDNQRDPEAWNRLGHWYFDNKMPHEAIAAYDKSLILRPNDPNILTDQGALYNDMLHEHEKALALFQKANGINPNHLQSLFNSGVALLNLGRKEEALAAWERLEKINPDFTTPRGIPISRQIEQLKNG